MSLNRLYHILYITFCMVCLPMHPSLAANLSKKFVVVIDAGHGGHDPGAVGKISKEKNINLSVALQLGNLIKEQCADTRVIYTRSRDVFIPLARRAEIANEAKADLFISIHTNSVGGNKSVQGASTWTLGLAKSDANLEVAKRCPPGFISTERIQTNRETHRSRRTSSRLSGPESQCNA